MDMDAPKVSLFKLGAYDYSFSPSPASSALYLYEITMVMKVTN